MSLKLVGVDELVLERYMVAQKRIGDDALATTKILARIPRLDGWPLHTELLTVDTAVERVEIERVVRKDWECGNGIADPVIGRHPRP